MKSVSIIGSNSYIARNLIFLINEEYKDLQLFLYDREDKHRDGLPNYSSIDVFDVDSLIKINFSVDAVIVFTGKTGTLAGFDDYKNFVEVNEIALLNIINVMRQADSKAKLVFPSTRLVYKGSDEPLKEDSAKEFKTIYAINKYSCENYLSMYSRIYGLRYCIFRICVPYGTLIQGATSYGTAEFFLSKAEKGENITLYGDGSVRRTLTYIGDLCRILIEGSLSDDCLNDVYNIGGEEYSLRQMAEIIAQKYGVDVLFSGWPENALKIESGSTVFDDSKLKSVLNCEYKVKFSNWIV